MFEKKKIKLENGKTVTLYLTSFLEQDIIIAVDAYRNTVAKSAFSVCCTFTQEADLEDGGGEREIKLGKHIADERGFDGKFLKLEIDGGYDLCPLKKVECELLHIEILDDKYSKVGLGSAMLKEIEKIARENNCERIYAKYHPFGKFSSGTFAFYTRNGFELVKNAVTGKTTAIKGLSKSQTDTLSSNKHLPKQKDIEKSKT